MGQILLSRGAQGQANLRQMEGLIDQINRQRAERSAFSGLLGESVIGRGLLDY